MSTVHQLGELGLIRRLRAGEGNAPRPGVLTGIGDDTAVLAVTPGRLLLATTDLVAEDVHFRRASSSFHDIGWKALAVNLSDIASMGGVPRWALVALALPADAEADQVDALYEGLRASAAPHDVAVVGGDTSASRSGWVITVTLLGEHAATPRLRSMARPGDVIAVTGSLGRSAAGLAALEPGTGEILQPLPASLRDEITRAHRRPEARVAEGQWLGAQPAVHAMMDASDGLASDLGHICRESRGQARVAIDRVPISAAVRAAAHLLGRDPRDWATSGGEDYELILTCEASAVAALADGLARATGTPLTAIGEIAAGEPRVVWLSEDGSEVSVVSGYEHFRG